MPRTKTAQKSRKVTRGNTRVSKVTSSFRSSRQTKQWSPLYTFVIMGVVLFILVVGYVVLNGQKNATEEIDTQNLPNQSIPLNSAK